MHGNAHRAALKAGYSETYARTDSPHHARKS
nr:terminase small subunit [Geomicrobium sp. JCM 19055]